MTGATLDTGALIAFERADRRVVALVSRALDHCDVLSVPAGVLAQAWRDGTPQARLGRLLNAQVVDVVPLDDLSARMAGQLCGVSGTADVVDASVIVCARQREQVVVTDDTEDLLRIDPTLRTVAI